MPTLLVDVVERIVVPITALPGPDADEPCEDTFALEALGRVGALTQLGPAVSPGTGSISSGWGSSAALR